MTLAITGATAAAFTPDDFEAYIAAGNNLFVYSTQFTLRNFNIGAPVNGASGEAAELMAAARQQGPGAYWVVGGADLATQLLVAGAVYNSHSAAAKRSLELEPSDHVEDLNHLG